MWEHCGHFSSCTQGPQLNNEEKIVLGWNNAIAGVASGWGSMAARLSRSCHHAVTCRLSGVLIHIFSLQRREPEQLQDNVITLVTPERS